jgi:hypothetical protein
LLVPRTGSPDTWDEKDGRSPTTAFAELVTYPCTFPITLVFA